MSGYQTIFKKEAENHLYPFFWQHGESHEILEKYVDKIYESQMKAICIEARPHPDFVKEKWWEDLNCILKKCKEKNMKVWILDDSHFPTGYANGKVVSSYPQYLKTYMWCRRYDVHGPIPQARINLQVLKGRIWEKPEEDIRILGVYMAKRVESEDDEIDSDTLMDISHCIDSSRLITVDIPKGAYSLFVVFETKKGGEETTKDYLNPLMKEATQILIDEVYEPHYQHFKEEFGKSIQAFFSDEPRFGNVKGCEATIGSDMPLPYRKDLEKEFSFDLKYLPLLWTKAQGKENEIRVQYMDQITKLYNENFTSVLGKWCEEHNVSYVGHTIEDNGAHARLGYGTGHYFRGQEGMHYAGIDVIGTQIVPGMNYHHDAFSTGGANGEFYHYALAKLGASASHLDPKKQGRCMCEAFGAYGWNEGLKTMKWIADSLMVRGVNNIVPHAFNPKEFPDWDCPPHFYAHGHNPQFPYFPVLDRYMNRICSLFSNGKYPSKVALYYPAENEWASSYTPVEKLSKYLTQNQIHFDIVSKDYILSGKCMNSKLKINETEFEVLLFPYSQYICKDLVDFLYESNVRVIFEKELPSKVIGESKYFKQWLTKVEILKDLDEYKIVPVNNKNLVVYEYEKENKKIYMFFNESVEEDIEFEFPLKNAYEYDAFKDELYEYDPKIHLSCYESKIIIQSKENYPVKQRTLFKNEKEMELDNWRIEFDGKTISNQLKFVSSIKGYEQVCGTAFYKTEFYLDSKCKTKLILEDVYEIAEVILNGKEVDTRICKPYVFDCTEQVQSGKNECIVKITNTLGTKIREPMSSYLPIEPFGFQKAILIKE